MLAPDLGDREPVFLGDPVACSLCRMRALYPSTGIMSICCKNGDTSPRGTRNGRYGVDAQLLKRSIVNQRAQAVADRIADDAKKPVVPPGSLEVIDLLQLEERQHAGGEAALPC